MARFTIGIIVLFLFGAGILSALGYRPSEQGRETGLSSQSLTACNVLIIYDGDTFGCDFNGDGKVTDSTEKIRMLGIDSPEMHYSRKNKTGKDEPGALEATRYAEHLILHKTVYLEFDQQRYDPYGRTLAYVYRDISGKAMLNEELLKLGLAKTLFIGINRKYETQFLESELTDRNYK